MTDTPVKPERITKPIQLLGAWLAGLLSIDACFLFVASHMPPDSWELRALVVAAILNVPLFLLAVFLLQTKFRPEMQEDSYYASYLSRKTNEEVKVTRNDALIASIAQRLSEIESKATVGNQEHIGPPSVLTELKIGVNKYLADRTAISKYLSDRGARTFSLFGGDEPPDKRIVAISQYLSEGTVSQVLQAAKELGFNYYTPYDNIAEQAREDVLFGSYGDYTEVIATGV